MSTSTSKVFVATPVRGNLVHAQYMMGMMQIAKAMPSEIEISLRLGGALPRARDDLSAFFLASTCTHILFIDSDISFTPDDVRTLLGCGKEFVSGVYSKRQGKAEIPARLTGVREGDLWEAEYLPAGFLLISRAVMERMAGAYMKLQYRTESGLRTALWAETFGMASYGGIDSYSGEDIAFCERWRQIGGQCWLHQGVLLPHVGEHTFLPMAPTGAPPKPING